VDKVHKYYILDDNKNPVQSSREDWNNFRKRGKLLFMDKVLHKKVRTVFHGMSNGEDDPCLFRTSVYSNINLTIYAENYKSYSEAKKGHREALAWVLVVSEDL